MLVWRSYNPGDRVTLTVKTTYGDAQPIPAVVGITVTDDAVLQRIERRLQPPRLPAMALLEGEVLSLMDAHTYVGDMFPTELPISDVDDVDATIARAGGAKPVALPKPVCRATVEPSVALDLLMGMAPIRELSIRELSMATHQCSHAAVAWCRS